jgi:fructose-1,6-bisphosphatase/inositol monophosphatase family enzyme
MQTEKSNLEYLNFAKEIGFLAGEIMLKYFFEENESRYKSDKTIVTKADTEINHMLIEKVKEKYPNHAVDGEEEQSGKSKYVWVCDPVDGTSMYACHIPVAVFSLALVVDGESIVGVVYDPFTKSMYTAIKGCGAYCNDKKIEVNKDDLTTLGSRLHCDMNTQNDFDADSIFSKLRKVVRVNDIGSIVRASCCVATGDYVGAIFTGTKHKNCDVAAVKVIIEEAGGKVTDLCGNEQRYDGDINGALITNGVVHDKVLDILQHPYVQ